MEFSLTDFLKVNDHVIKAITYNAVTGDHNTVWGASNDRKLRQFERLHLQQQAEYETRNASIMCLAQSVNLRLLFAGCEDGTLRVFNTYLAEKSVAERKQVEKLAVEGGADTNPPIASLANTKDKPNILIESHFGHQGAITRLCVTYTEDYVISVGEDGIVTLWDITAPHKTAKKEIKYTEEILIERRDLEELTSNIVDLQSKVQEIQQRRLHQSKKRRRKHEELMHKLEEEHREEKTRQDAQFFKLDAEIAEHKLKFGEMLRELDQKHLHNINHIDQDYNAKIQTLREQSHRLRHVIEEQRHNYETEMINREKQWEQVLSEEKERHEKELENVNKQIAAVMDEEAHVKEEAEMIQRAIEEETESEIISLKEAFEKQRATEETFIAKLQSENSTLLNDENNKRQDLDAKKADITEKLKQQSNLDLQVEGLNRDIEAINNELKERSETISDKDKRIYELKKKNQELEKFKFVLEYKIKELKSQIDPKEEEIRQAQSKYAEMELESDRYLRNNEALVLQIRTLKLKLNGHNNEIETLQEKVKEQTEYQSRLWTELSDAQQEKNPKKLKELVKMLYFEHTQEDSVSGTNVYATIIANAAKTTSRTTEDAQRDYNRERDYLERTLTGLKRKLVKSSDASRTDKARIISENVTLIKEINDLRREVRNLSMNKRSMIATSGDDDGTNDDTSEIQREIQIQHAEIHRMRAHVDELEGQVHAAGRAISQVTPPVM